MDGQNSDFYVTWALPYQKNKPKENKNPKSQPWLSIAENNLLAENEPKTKQTLNKKRGKQIIKRVNNVVIGVLGSH